MPVPPPPEAGPLPRERFIPAFERVETQNYRDRTNDLRRDWSQKISKSTFLRVKYGLIDAQSELNRITTLRHDWDSYGAEPPTPQAVRVSKDILDDLSAALILPSTIVPSASGGVSIYFISDDRTAYIESYNDGTQALVLYDRHDPPEVLELGTDIQRAEVSERISRYLDRT